MKTYLRYFVAAMVLGVSVNLPVLADNPGQGAYYAPAAVPVDPGIQAAADKAGAAANEAKSNDYKAQKGKDECDAAITSAKVNPNTANVKSVSDKCKGADVTTPTPQGNGQILKAATDVPDSAQSGMMSSQLTMAQTFAPANPIQNTGAFQQVAADSSIPVKTLAVKTVDPANPLSYFDDKPDALNTLTNKVGVAYNTTDAQNNTRMVDTSGEFGWIMTDKQAVSVKTTAITGVAPNYNPAASSLTPQAVADALKPKDPTTTASSPDVTTPDAATAAQDSSKYATDMLAKGEWPTSKADRVALAVQYLREKGYSEKVIQEVVGIGNRENGSWDPSKCTDLGSSACGLFQYTNGTWKAQATQYLGTTDGRFDAQAQLDVMAAEVDSRLTKYDAGTLYCGGGSMSFSQCDYVYHYAGSFDPNHPERVSYALNYTAQTYNSGNALYAAAAAKLDGTDVGTVLAGMNTEVQAGGGLGGSIGNTLSGGGANFARSFVNQVTGGNTAVADIVASAIGGDSSGLYGGSANSLMANSILQQYGGVLGNTGSGSSGSTSGNTSGGSYTDASYSDDTFGVKLTGYQMIQAKTILKTCGQDLPTSDDAIMLMVARCRAINPDADKQLDI